MKNIEKIARNPLAVLSNLPFVDTSLERNNKLVPILLNNKTDKLLQTTSAPCEYGQRPRTYLCNIKIRLHNKERVQRVLARGVWIVEEILDFSESCLSEPRPSVLWGQMRLCMCLLQTKRLRRMNQCRKDSGV